jgi:hypothetical protein
MNELVPARNSIIRSMDDAERAAIAMSKSGFFTDAADAGKAIVKILAGQEMGFGPFASMTGIFIIQGRPSIGANLMAAAVKGSGRYDYRVIELSDTACELAFFQGAKEIGRSRFTMDDAKKAGTKNVDKFPRNMLFARAISNGVRWFCPDVFNGSAVYTPEELGAETDENGDVIGLKNTIPWTQAQTAKPAPDFTVIERDNERTVFQPEQPALAKYPNDKPIWNIDDAEAEVSTSHGLLYGQISTSQLAIMATALQKASPRDEDQERKLKAAKMILAARNKGRKVMPTDPAPAASDTETLF